MLSLVLIRNQYLNVYLIWILSNELDLNQKFILKDKKKEEEEVLIDSVIYWLALQSINPRACAIKLLINIAL